MPLWFAKILIVLIAMVSFVVFPLIVIWITTIDEEEKE